MDFPLGRLAAVAMLTLMLLPTTLAKMHVFFNDGYMTFGFDQTQRCYTIAHCWNDHSENANWQGLPDDTEMVFYEKSYCKGISITKALHPQGSCDFTTTKLFNKVSSFMVRQYSEFPVNGIEDRCHEDAKLNSTNSTFTGYFGFAGSS